MVAVDLCERPKVSHRSHTRITKSIGTCLESEGGERDAVRIDKQAFFGCSDAPIPILSMVRSRGVRASSSPTMARSSGSVMAWLGER
jgi:hypothetical protein